jgi:hypothetical protein
VTLIDRDACGHERHGPLPCAACLVARGETRLRVPFLNEPTEGSAAFGLHVREFVAVEVGGAWRWEDASTDSGPEGPGNDKK